MSTRFVCSKFVRVFVCFTVGSIGRYMFYIGGRGLTLVLQALHRFCKSYIGCYGFVYDQ